MNWDTGTNDWANSGRAGSATDLFSPDPQSSTPFSGSTRSVRFAVPFGQDAGREATKQIIRSKGMMKKLTVLATIAVAGVMLAAQSVQAQEIDFGFEVNSTKSLSGKRIFQYNAVTMSLEAVQGTTVDLTVNDLEFDDASFVFQATAGSTTESVVGSQTFLLTPFTGTFSFREAGTGDLLLEIQFTDAILSAREGARNGALFQSDEDSPGGTITLTVGAKANPGGLVTLAPEGFSFALGSANPRFDNDADGGEANNLDGFSAKSSFIADTAAIPEPSGFVLTAFGMLGFAALRRRQRK